VKGKMMRRVRVVLRPEIVSDPKSGGENKQKNQEGTHKIRSPAEIKTLFPRMT